MKQALKTLDIKLSQQLLSGKEAKTAVLQENSLVPCSRAPSVISTSVREKASRQGRQLGFQRTPAGCQRAAAGSRRSRPVPGTADSGATGSPQLARPNLAGRPRG